MAQGNVSLPDVTWVNQSVYSGRHSAAAETSTMLKHECVVTLLILAPGLVAVTTGQSGGGADWPEWRGPGRTGVSTDTGLITQWPPSGPPRVWATSGLGAGHGSVAVAGTQVFVQGMQEEESVVSSLNRVDGTLIWTRALGLAGYNAYGSGPRGTPTVDGDRIYILTEVGELACLRGQDGSVIWQRNILEDFNGRIPAWLISESPLVDGDRLIVTPGGPNAGMVALDKMSGETIWVSTELSDQAGYASPVVADVDGVRTVMTLTAEAGVGVRASDGHLMWRYPRAANSTANITTPVFYDNKVFYTSAYGTGGALLGLSAEAGEVGAEEIYFTRDLENHHGGVVLVDGYLYGFHHSILTCVRFATGEVMWRDRSVGKGSLAYADGHLYVLSERNVVALVEASPAEYVEKGRFRIADQAWPSWAHPVVSGGRLYIRNQETLAAYDLLAP